MDSEQSWNAELSATNVTCMTQTKSAIRLSLTAGAVCLGMIVAMIFLMGPMGRARPLNGAASLFPAASRQTTLDDAWSVVPDVYQMNDGRLRLVYIENFSIRGNSQIADSTDGGASFVFEYNNPFGDHDIANPNAGNTNVDPAVLRLKSDYFIAVTMREAKL